MSLTATLITLAIFLLVAKIGGDVAVRLRQPEVLGELLAGIIVGNLALIGIHNLEYIKHDHLIEIFAEIGIILLLFEVGLETNLREMRRVGMSSLIVALLGVVAPFLLGWGVSSYFLPSNSALEHAFIGAVLVATSVGITARVLKELGKVKSPEGQIILGAAVIDDVLGLVVLSVMTAMIAAANSGSELQFGSLALTVGKAVGTLVVMVLIGGFLLRRWFRLGVYLRTHQTLLPLSLIVCFSLSYLAGITGLAPIVGAFIAGLIIEPSHYEGISKREGAQNLEHKIEAITSLFLPVFFVLMGAKVDLRVFAQSEVVVFALCLSVVAVVGKQICSLGVLEKHVDRIAVGFGMIPRGEVGLIFASIGAALTLDGKPVIDTSTYAAVVIMVILTTLCTPPLLKWKLTTR